MLKDLLRYKPNAVRVGAVLIAIFLVLMAAAYMVNRSFTLTFWDKGYELRADFVDADGIAMASDVRLAGAYVGQVTDIRSVQGGLAEITFRLDPQHQPMREGTHVSLRLQTLLGQKFLELLPGPPNAANLANNSLIPSNKTTSPVDFDQFLQEFDKPTRDGVSTIIKELGLTVDQRGSDVNAFLGELQQLSVNSTPDLQTFSGRSQNINDILVNLASVGNNLADNRQHLANVESNLNSLLGTIAANDTAFRKFIHQGNISLGHGITQLDGEQQNFNDTLRLLNPALHKLTPLLVDVNDKAHQFDSFMKISEVFTGDLFSSATQYNHNPKNTTCGAPGCGGYYLRQPSILANPQAGGETSFSAGGTPQPGARAASPASPVPAAPLLPGLLNIPPGLPAPNLPHLPVPLPTPSLPGLLGPTTTSAPTSPQQDLFNWLIH